MHYGTANALKREGMIKGLIHEATALKQERVTLKHERHQIQIRKEEAILSKALLANAPVLHFPVLYLVPFVLSRRLFLF
jgi:hypothetical protein